MSLRDPRSGSRNDTLPLQRSVFDPVRGEGFQAGVDADDEPAVVADKG